MLAQPTYAQPAPEAPEAHTLDLERFVAMASGAARSCRAQQIEPATAELGILLEQLTAELGDDHALTNRVRLTLARLERRQGNSDRARELEEFTGTRVGRNVEPVDLGELDRALKKLRGCPPRKRRRAVLAEGSLPDELGAARLQLAAGHYRDALPHAKRAYELAQLDPEPTTRLRAAEILAQVRLVAGDPEALKAARAALAAAVEANSLDSRISSSRLIAQAGDLDAAAQALEDIAPAIQDARLLAELEEARGDVALQLGSPRNAIEHLEAALAGHRATGQSPVSIAAVAQLLGDAQRAAGNYPAAAAAYAEARQLRSTVLGEFHPETARTLNAIGVLYTDFGNWAQADVEFASAEAKFRKSLGAEHPETRLAAVNRSLARWSGARSEAAADEYERAVAAWAESLGDSHPSIAEAWRNLAFMQIELEHGDRAESLLERALSAQTSSFGESHPSVALTRLARGRLFLRRGKLELARADVQAALEIQQKALGGEHPAVARTRLQLSRTATAAGDAESAWREAREAARVLDLHIRRAFGAMTDRERTLFADQARDVVGALLSVDSAPGQELLAALLPHRDSVLRSIAGQRAQAREADPRMRALLDELRSLRSRYAAATLSTSPEMAQRANELGARIDDFETRAALAGIRRDEPDAQRLLFRACERLPRDATLIEFVAYDRSLAGGAAPLASYAALLVSVDCHVERVDLGPAEPIDQAAEAFAAAMRDQVSDAPDAREQLRNLLLAPLAKSLQNSRRWFVVPDGSLWGVPFGALPDTDGSQRYLIERVTISYLTSLHELAEANRVAATDIGTRPLLFGAPDFGASDAGESNGPVVLTASGPCQLPPFEPLPGTKREIAALGTLLPNARSVVGADATKTRLIEELNRKPSILHLATHAYFAGLAGCQSAPTSESAVGSPKQRIAPNPLLLSGIAFAGANRNEANATGVTQMGSGSSILTAFESSGLDLRATRLVVLSACDTGTGLQQRGQEVQGLRWGFRAAGARALVTSLWRSNDRATRQLMLKLYEALGSDELRKDVFAGAEALRRAQLERIEQDTRLGLRRPLLWSNFVFSGVL